MEDLGAKVSYLVVKTGIPVFAKDGEKLGTVVRSLAAPASRVALPVTIEAKFVPMRNPSRFRLLPPRV